MQNRAVLLGRSTFLCSSYLRADFDPLTKRHSVKQPANVIRNLSQVNKLHQEAFGVDNDIKAIGCFMVFGWITKKTIAFSILAVENNYV